MTHAPHLSYSGAPLVTQTEELIDQFLTFLRAEYHVPPNTPFTLWIRPIRTHRCVLLLTDIGEYVGLAYPAAGDITITFEKSTTYCPR